jgi:hypothetical protein
MLVSKFLQAKNTLQQSTSVRITQVCGVDIGKEYSQTKLDVLPGTRG